MWRVAITRALGVSTVAVDEDDTSTGVLRPPCLHEELVGPVPFRQKIPPRPRGGGGRLHAELFTPRGTIKSNNPQRYSSPVRALMILKFSTW